MTLSPLSAKTPSPHYGSSPLFSDPDGVQERVLLLPPHNLCPLLHARHRFLGESPPKILPKSVFKEQVWQWHVPVYIFTGLVEINFSSLFNKIDC